MFGHKMFIEQLVCFAALSSGLFVGVQEQIPQAPPPLPNAREELLAQEPPEFSQYQRSPQSRGLEMKREQVPDKAETRSPDGQRLAQIVKSKEKKKVWVVEVDGVAGAEYQWVGRPVFSPDSQHLAYLAIKAKKRSVIVVDGKEGPDFEDVGPILFERYNFSTWTILTPVFSPDGRQLAYLGKRAGKWRIVMDGHEGPPFEGDPLVSPTFSGDGKHVAVLACKETFNYTTIVEILDGASTFQFPIKVWTMRNMRLPFVEHLMFSPDGTRLAYVIGHAGSKIFEGKPTQARRQAIVDRHEGTAYDCLDIDPRFSSDGKHFIYTVHKRDKEHNSMVVIDGLEGKPYDDVFAWKELITEGASPEYTFLYMAREGNRFYRVTQSLPGGNNLH